ncbi:phosphatase [Opitutaceae bacterium EW11]|nr:phosphatase [Opitutaceae bacterium EW11]
MSAPIAVIDIGSNSIKVLVAERTPAGTLSSLGFKTLDARISAGISRAKPLLSEEGMQRGRAAVRELVADARAFFPNRIILVATSAVRDALNGPAFCAAIQADTGYAVRVLSGQEEASLIGRGLRCDPAIAALSDFSMFDLGGGSLECLTFRQGRTEQAVSLALGCVRLTERYVADPSAPITTDAIRRISELTKEVVAKSGFHFAVGSEGIAVGTGGTLTTVRAILGERAGRKLEETDTLLPLPVLRSLLAEIGGLALEERRKVPGLPAGRADVFPTALATFIALAELGGIQAYRNSLYNLRWGVADETLDG